MRRKWVVIIMAAIMLCNAAGCDGVKDPAEKETGSAGKTTGTANSSNKKFRITNGKRNLG